MPKTPKSDGNRSHRKQMGGQDSTPGSGGLSGGSDGESPSGPPSNETGNQTASRPDRKEE